MIAIASYIIPKAIDKKATALIDSLSLPEELPYPPAKGDLLVSSNHMYGVKVERLRWHHNGTVTVEASKGIYRFDGEEHNIPAMFERAIHEWYDACLKNEESE